MKYTERKLLAALTAVAIAPFVGGSVLSWISPNAVAATSTVNITVTASVPSNCNFPGAAPTLAFGSYDPTAAQATADLDGSITFDIRCTKGTSAVLSMNNGLHASGVQRRMDNAGVTMDYQLYTSNAYSTIWDTTNTVTYNATSASPTPITVYGRIPQNQTDVTVGSYSDTVVMTATF